MESAMHPLPKKFIKELKANENVDSVFLVFQKTMPTGKSGKAYLNLKLGDKTGEIEGRIWENVDQFSGKFNQADFVRIIGRTQLYQDKIQLNITQVEIIQEDQLKTEDFLPITRFDIETMYAELLALIKKEVDEPDVQRLLLAIFENPEIAKKFKKAPAAKSMHHAFIGGLLEHELGLARLAIDVCKHYPHIQKSYVIAGCLLHDIGKIDELKYDRYFEYSDEGKLIGHLVMGIELVTKTATSLPNFPERTALLVKHLIASHHGSLEFGSPKIPYTLEAIMVHYLDDMDSKLQAMKGLIDKEWETNNKWTSYHRLFERFMYKGTTWEDSKPDKK
jgi:3'-5' exoribonuclease